MKHMSLISRFSVILGFFATVSLAEVQKEGNSKPPTDKPADNKEINWLAYDTGLQKAKTEDKHVFVDFSTKWCGWCKKMDRETFSRPEVIQMINENFIPIKVDGDSKRELDIDGYKITEKNLTRKEFGVRGYPAFWFLKSDGTKLGMIRGYRNADYMLEALAYVKDYKYDTTRTETTPGKEKDKSKK